MLESIKQKDVRISELQRTFDVTEAENMLVISDLQNQVYQVVHENVQYDSIRQRCESNERIHIKHIQILEDKINQLQNKYNILENQHHQFLILYNNKKLEYDEEILKYSNLSNNIIQNFKKYDDEIIILKKQKETLSMLLSDCCENLKDTQQRLDTVEKSYVKCIEKNNQIMKKECNCSRSSVRRRHSNIDKR